ncbi:MAG: hypothetical protein DI536_25545 [Archangium gephyra]|uniref:TolB protein n=1 Tax=Archangium gephyra TaxID=48 RepID=A0A2W5T525_9BACT|nr:MAG: hypothetical protein DI536_25545 [Archangium gephyra]
MLFPSKTPFPLNIPGSDIRSFHVNPAGRMVAVSADVVMPGRFDLVTVNHDGTNVRTLYQSPAGSNVSYVRFAPNGQRISFEVRDASNNAQMFVVPVTGGSHINVTPPMGSPRDPSRNIINSSWSRDSRYLAIVAEATYDRLNELFLVDMNASTPTAVPLLTASTLGTPGTGTSFWGVTSPVQWPSASRAELLFKYRTTADTAFRLMRISTSGAGLAPVPGTPDGVTMTGWAGSFGIGNDGTTLVFSADTVTPQAYDVYQTTLGASSSTAVATGAAAMTRPDFNREMESNSTTTHFAFSANWASGGTIFEPWVLSGAGPTRLAAFPNAGSYVDDFTWSPDGSQLAMVTDFRTDERFELALLPTISAAGTPEILVAPVAGGRVVDATWTP